MRYRKTENTMSLLGGALLGATAMYLLDPDMGRKRREYVKDQAGDYAGAAGDALQSGWGKVSEGARGVSRTIADKAEEYGQRLSDMAHEYGEKLSDHAKDASGSAKDYSSSFGDTLDDLRDRGRKWFGKYTGKARSYARDKADDYSDAASDAGDDITAYGNRLWKQVRGLGSKLSDRASDAADDLRSRAGEQHDSPVLPVTITAIGCCAMGVGLMYLMDPQRGRSRRAWLTDKMTSLVRQTGQTFYRTGHDLANRTQGLAHETVSRYTSSGPVSGEQLRDRVRSEIGRVVSQPRLVQVMADSNGSVTLSGSVRPEEAEKLVAAVEAIPGVSLVISRIEVQSAGSGSSGQSTGQSVPQM